MEIGRRKKKKKTYANFPDDLHNFFQQDMDSYDEKRERGRERAKERESGEKTVRERGREGV